MKSACLTVIPENRFDVVFTGLLAHVFISGQYWTTVINPNPKDTPRDSEAKIGVFMRVSMGLQETKRLQRLAPSLVSMIKERNVRTRRRNRKTLNR